MITKAELIPIEELGSLLLPHTKTMMLVMAGFFVLKYLVYEIVAIRDLNYLKTTDHKPGYQSYLVLGAYPVCDIARLLVALGLLSAIVNGLVQQRIVFNTFVDHVILFALIIAVFFINYFCKDTETMLVNMIPTAVIILAAVIFSRGMFWQGLQLM